MSDKNNISDQDIDSYLQGKDELSSFYSDSKELKAPGNLELKVKRMAREAERQSGNLPVGNKNNLLIPLSIAATIVIAITLTFYPDIRDPDKNKQIAGKNKDKQQEPAKSQQQMVINSEPQQSQTASVAVTRKPAPPAPEKSQQEIPGKIATRTEEFEIPEHLREMIQATHGSGDNALLPAEILKTWSQPQWQQQILTLQKDGNIELANKYIEEYPKYYPDQKLDLTE